MDGEADDGLSLGSFDGPMDREVLGVFECVGLGAIEGKFLGTDDG